MTRFPCPYLKAEVELTEEREHHIAERHPDLLPGTVSESRKSWRTRIKSAGAFGSEGRDCSRGGTLIWHRGRHVMVVVVSEPALGQRHWIITAYITAKLVEGEVEWKIN